VGRALGFWLLGLTLLTVTAAAAAPSPLYPVYQRLWGLSAITMTAVFGIYAIALLAALLTVGSLSDHVGRRPVLIAGLLLEAVSMASFMSADRVGLLFAARVLQGLATGAILGTLSAALVDLQPLHRPRLASVINSAGPGLGLAAGAVGSGLLVQYAPAPTALGFALLGLAFVGLAAAITVLPEPVTRRAGALGSLRPRVTVPDVARRPFRAAAPALVATWAVVGLYLALGPSLAASVLHAGNHLVGGAVVATLNVTGALASIAAIDLSPRRAMRAGAAVLAVGLAVTLLALNAGSLPGFFAGTAVAGAGFGVTFLGAFGSLVTVAAPAERAGLFAAIFVVSYLALSLPTMVAGALVPVFGLQTIAIGYGGLVIALALVALLAPQRRPALASGSPEGCPAC
jgi:MFS family permease